MGDSLTLINKNWSNSMHRLKNIILYRNLLKETKKFHNVNMAEYFLREIRKKWRTYSIEKNSLKFESFSEEAIKALNIIRRQVIISSMYSNPQELPFKKD